MGLKVPDVLRYELRHRLECLQDSLAGRGVRSWVNAHPGLAATVACGSVLLLILGLVQLLRPASHDRQFQGPTAWFYDAGTGSLFTDNARHTGPIEAPSGALIDGTPAGYRAHVYSYVLHPNDSELFVGFMERPDPWSGRKASASEMAGTEEWAQGRLIRRVDDKDWVAANSDEGQAIMEELLQPDSAGRTPIYQLPKEP